MITMENVLKRGRTVWDRDLLSEDEYVERARLVREAAAARGFDAVATFGHTAHYGNLTYLSGNVPPLGWMSVVVGVEEEAGPLLVTGGGSRDLPFLRTQTWIPEIRTSPSLFSGPAESVSAALAEVVPEGKRVALVGAREELAPAAVRDLLAALSGYDAVEVDDLLAPLRAVKRPRERVAIERSLTIARAAVAEAVAAWEGGSSATASLLAAERAARSRGARDVRVLGNVDGPWLAPVEAASDARGAGLAVWCAVESIGYWAQACADTTAAGSATAARRAVGAMVEAAAPGAPASALVNAAVAVLPGGEEDVALAYGLGDGAGLDLEERPRIGASSDDVLVAGAVVGLRAVTVENGALTCASETIHVTDDGVVVL
jgi:Xaa-Pro aminopeptidase